jgi:hypothetical protein
MKKPHTITFYLTTEYAEELDRISKSQRISPPQWCKTKVQNALQGNMVKQGSE